MTIEEKNELQENIELSRNALKNALAVLKSTGERITALDLTEYFFNTWIREKSEKNFKNHCLNYIYENPYIMFDLNFNREINEILPFAILHKYEQDEKELKIAFLSNKLTKEEYDLELERLKFSYFESSNQGNEIGKKFNIIKQPFNVKVKKVVKKLTKAKEYM